ncbi:tRNA(Ile)-lysidine synthase [BD1-7 clade bacterium]|uniref:tRNA(Ile)-lysidine synthase n=1 Tax=BD1-7 clade bacterium TaxID=2029982 RepID=A0A5S9PWD7_9GAMM|nr:tRNA(Ile)-lysidine synthase [BD1-7 clade bacterium]
MIGRLYPQVSAHTDAVRWVVGLSGGVDSVVLLHLLHTLPQHFPDISFPKLCAIHVNHQLQPLAGDWQHFCESLCEPYNIPCESVCVTVDNGASLEANAREARYRAFEAHLTGGDVLMLAHHQGDQAETFLYRLMRGAGLRGLASIQQHRTIGSGCLLRPLLGSSKQAILDWAQMHQLSWVDDPSNGDLVFDRNYLRHSVLPTIRQRWPAADSQIERAISHVSEAHSLLDVMADEDLSLLDQGREYGEPWLLLPANDVDWMRRKNILRRYLDQFDVVLTDTQWRAFKNDLVDAANDAVPEFVVGQCCLRRYRGRLYVTSASQNADPFLVWGDSINWNGQGELDIPGFGTLLLRPQPKHPLDISLRRREGGLSLRTDAPNARRKPLKRIFQEAFVPPWQRDRLPLIYVDGELVAVGDRVRLQGAAQKLGSAEFEIQPSPNYSPT